MKKIYSLIAVLMFLAGSIYAGNTKQTIAQVTSATTVSTDVDFIITGATPFTTTGSVDITDTEHGVVIIQKIKPSAVISSWLSHIYINGEKAVNGTNCQVRMYNRGAIIFPYGSSFKPLTCYTEKGFGGTSCDNYSEGSTGGYMNTLTAGLLNNNIRSFKLKRGYMVTFALGTSGWGYSRVFIADQEDLEMDIPANMSGRISSYRLFKWWNTHKAGLASSGDATANAAVNSAWCYDWAQGNASLLPDVEWVPNHIYEDWPSSATCGSVTGSCHMKTNNEPGNSADDHPQSVDVILDNWQNLMRTGMRLCSESSHDGSWSHLRAFIDSIDARGWRCDLLDLHCYWGAGNFNDFSGYYNSYGGRPIWISEWVWGASWNSGNWSSGGIFAQAPDGSGSFSTANQQKCYDGTVPILEKLNASQYVERYAYWNSEAVASKIYYDGQLSILGKYYANMNEGLGYNSSIQKVPNVVYSAPSGLTGTYTKSSGSFYMTWTDKNGDMLDSMVVECKYPGEASYKWVSSVKLKDLSGKNASYSATVYPEPGASYYRVGIYAIGSKTARYSDAVSVSVSSAKGDSIMQYGKIDVTNLNSISTSFTEQFDSNPAVFMGVCTNKNSTTTPGNLITSVAKGSFAYQIFPWQQSGTQTITTAESVPFLAMQYGNYKYGDLDIEIGSLKVKADTIQVTFSQAFPEGVVPIVITELKPGLKTNPILVRIWDVTNTGFKVTAFYEAGLGKKLSIGQTLSYFAITPGQARMNDNLIISAGMGDNVVYGSSYRKETFRKTNLDGTISEGADSLALINPYIFGGFQTYNYPTGAVPRRFTDMTVKGDDEVTYTYGTRITRNVDKSGSTTPTNNLASGDKFGWICISSAPAKDFEDEDVNQDGSVDSQDVLKIYDFMKTSTGTETDPMEDVNGDGGVDSQDVLKVYDYMKQH